MTVPQIEWIGVDWGTSNLRAYAMDQEGHLQFEVTSNKGMATLQPDEFEPALLELIGNWLVDGKTIPVFACGMVGARQGWFEAAYRSVPCSPVSGLNLTHVETHDRRICVEILPGLSQSMPADVMRGEETQIAGLLAQESNFSGSICLPGTHSKWAKISNGEVVSFQTFMTGELFSILSNHSVLCHSVSDHGFDESAFMDEVVKIVDKPLTLARKLFSIRAESLLRDQEASVASARLSGLLVGQELSVTQDHWDGEPVVIIGSIAVTKLYHSALVKLGADVRHVEVAEATLSGLKIAAAQSVATYVTSIDCNSPGYSTI